MDVDVEKRTLKVQLDSLFDTISTKSPPMIEVPYDKLVVAVGCKVNDDIVMGAGNHALNLKTCDDARLLHNSIGECLGYASRPDVADEPNRAESERHLRREERRKRATFSIVGGGPTGDELAGELSNFFADITKPRKGAFKNLRDDLRIALVQGGSELVPQFDPKLRRHALDSRVPVASMCA